MALHMTVTCKEKKIMTKSAGLGTGLQGSLSVLSISLVTGYPSPKIRAHNVLLYTQRQVTGVRF